MQIFKILEKNIISIWGFILVFLISGIWFFQKGYILMTDLVGGPHREYLWNSSTILMNAILYLGDFIGSEFSSKFIYVFTFLVLYFSGVYLAKVFTDDKYLQILLGSFSILNLFVYERILYGQIGVVLASAFCALFFASIYKLYFINENFKAREIILTGVVGGLAIDSSLHTVFFLAFVLLVFFIVDLFEKYKNKIFTFKFFLNLIYKNILIFSVSIFVNIGFIINSFLGRNDTLSFAASRIGNLDLVAFQTAGQNIFEKIFNIYMLTGFWGREQKRFLDITDNPLWFIGFLPFMFLIIFGIYKMYKENKKLFYICFLFLIFVPILAIATSVPILDIMYKYIPFYSGLREPQKWAMLLAPVYIIAIIFGIKSLKNILNISQNILISFFICMLFIFQFRFLFGIWGQMRAVQYPESWYKVDEIVKSENLKKYNKECVDENLFLPWHLYTSFPFTKNVVANPAGIFFSCKTITGTNMEFGDIFDNNKNNTTDKYGYWLFENNKSAPPKNTNFIIVSKAVDWERYHWLKENTFVENIFEDGNVVLYRVKY